MMFCKCSHNFVWETRGRRFKSSRSDQNIVESTSFSPCDSDAILTYRSCNVTTREAGRERA
jgi:hypothetical protein